MAFGTIHNNQSTEVVSKNRAKPIVIILSHLSAFKLALLI